MYLKTKSLNQTCLICIAIRCNIIIYFLHVLSDFGNRPRRLYVIVNPVSGEGQAATDKIWQKIQRMFQVGQIVTDVISKSVHMDCTLSRCSFRYMHVNTNTVLLLHEIIPTISMLGI